MNLIKQYYIEEYGYKFLETSEAYIMYKKYEDNSVYIEQMFVKQENRNQGLGKKLYKKLLDKEKPNSVYCDVDLLSNSGETTLEIFKSQGFKVDSYPNKFRVILWKDYGETN